MTDTKTGSGYLAQIEQAVDEIQKRKNVQANLEIIRKMLNLEFDAKCERVYLTQNETQSYFFGVHVFPSRRELARIADQVADVEGRTKFTKCNEFVIELDSKLVYRIGATPREITAAILHEIGHKVYSKESMLRAKATFLATAGKWVGIGTSLVRLVSPLKFLLYTAILSFFSSSVERWSSLRGELDADSFAVRYGYAADLHSLIGKIMGDNAIAFALAKRGSEVEKGEKDIMKWSFRNIVDFSIRRAQIERQLKAQLREEPSEYGREVLQDQLQSIARAKRATAPIAIGEVGEDVLELDESADIRTREDLRVERLYAQLMSESIKSFMELHSKGYSFLELEEIEVEIERIEIPEDKMYLITRIYRNLSVGRRALRKIESQLASRPHLKARADEIREFISKLEELLKRVRAVKIKEPEYGIVIKYPKGDYEE